MNTREKLQRWIDESGSTQTDLARQAGVAPNKLSQILAGTYGPTHTCIVPLSRAMEVSLDWLYDDKAEWPPVPREGKGRFLTPAQEKILELAALLTDGDVEDMQPAIKRMMGVPLGAEAGESPALRPKSPTHGDQVRDRNHDDGPRRRGRNSG